MSAQNNNNRNGQDRRYQGNRNYHNNNIENDYLEDNLNDRPRGPGGRPPRQQQRGQRGPPRNNNNNNNNNRGYPNRVQNRAPIARANFADDAPPVPGHLSKAHSPMQNDPLMKASIVGEPDIGLSPIADDPNIYSACDGLTTIIDLLYEKAVSAKQGFSKRVPSSCFATYCATLTYARLLSIHGQNGYRLTPDELEFVRLLKQSEYIVPSILAVYLNGFGNTKIPDGRHLKFKLDKPTYRDGCFNGATIPGYFQQVTAQTHFRYKSYPCLAVYYQRVLADILQTNDQDNDLLEDGFWDLPDDIVPYYENRNYPTENLLGYRQAQRLSNVELNWVTNVARFNNDHPGFEDLSIPFSSNLMNAVCTELRQVEAFKFEQLNIQVPQGSLGQLMTEKAASPEQHGTIENEKIFSGSSMNELNQIVVCLAGPLRYRVLHTLGRVYNDWSIYSFNDLADVPQAWQDTINTLRINEYPEIGALHYHTSTFDPALRVRSFIDNDSNQKKLFY